MDRFKKTYKGRHNTPLHADNPYDFLENLNIIHFDELKKIYPDAHFPKFDINRVDDEHIIIEYSSYRDIPYLVYGLIDGCLDYYCYKADIQMTKTDKEKTFRDINCPVYVFEVKKV